MRRKKRRHTLTTVRRCNYLDQMLSRTSKTGNGFTLRKGQGVAVVEAVGLLEVVVAGQVEEDYRRCDSLDMLS